jgi:glucuronoarabinoxylan endo-1,4-beta-xylanase
LWETEVATLSDTFDPSITNAMYWAQRIHLFLTVPEVNAWHYWWLISGNHDNEGLMGTGDIPTKRMYVLGQYSRFVRPGYYRMGAVNTGDALITAYQDTNSGSFAIVAVNTDATDINQTFTLNNFATTSVTPWITSSTFSLTNLSSVSVNGSSFSYTLPAMSVVTFVGQISAPMLNASMQNRNLILSWPTNNSGFQLMFTTNLAKPSWSPAPGTPAQIAGQFVVTNVMTNRTEFFRIMKP